MDNYIDNNKFKKKKLEYNTHFFAKKSNTFNNILVIISLLEFFVNLIRICGKIKFLASSRGTFRLKLFSSLRDEENSATE